MLRLVLLFGGKSPEHEVSIVSARNIWQAIPKDKFEVLLVGISPKGKWYLEQPENHAKKDFVIGKDGIQLAILPGDEQHKLLRMDNHQSLGKIDAVFPITHGPNGEDGTLQGLLTQLDLPFVGPGVLASALAMDKDYCKRILTLAGIPNAPYVTLYKHDKGAINYASISAELGHVLFIKPANMGSSIGVRKTTNEQEFLAAVEHAFQFDIKILVEQGVNGREIECAVLGNEFPEASTVGEIVMNTGFYDFESKYQSADAATLYIPAQNLTPEEIDKIRATAMKAYQVLGLEGMSRVDVFLTPQGEVYINEPNTLPGFTSISMYPKLWEHSGLPYSDLIVRLVDIAIQRHRRDSSIKRERI
ncbi:MAG: D-alanine--D-alanine ligase [Chitinophagales bacterium]|nr:D-alanine--D-alanine ligase [Chitinophagales bacterium]